MNIMRDSAYLKPDTTMEVWETLKYEHLFVVVNRENLYFRLYPTLQSYVNYTKGVSDNGIDLTKQQFTDLEDLDITEVK